ncbi:MAG: LysR family transcriptional regulator [Pseudomonadota bacterium]
MSDPSGRLTLRAVEIFVAVVEEASLGGGARRLGASPSAVSQQVANLEDALGAQLIDRSARPFALTPAGQLFHARALSILDEVSKARAELAEVELTTFRRLRLALVDEFDHEILPKLLAQMARAFPDCSFTARSGLSHENLAALESRSVDMVFSADLDQQPDWVERHPVLRDPFVLVTARGVLEPGLPAAQVMEVLSGRPMIRYSQFQVLGRLVEAHLRRMRVSPERRFEIATNPGVLASTATMKGWTITTALAFMSVRRQHPFLEARVLPFAGFSRSISVYARGEVMGALPRRTAELLRDLLGEEVRVAQTAMPWLGDAYRVLSDDTAAAEI